MFEGLTEERREAAEKYTRDIQASIARRMGEAAARAGRILIPEGSVESTSDQ